MSTDPQGGERHDGALGALVRALGCSYEETFSIASGSIPSLQNQPFASNRPLGSYDFLIGPLLYADTLREAEAFARASGVAPHEALLALGWITADDYAALLGAALGLEVIANRPFRLLRRRPSTRSILTDGVLASAVIGEVEGQSRLLLDCTAFSPDAINELMARPDLTAWPPVLVTRRGLAEAILRGEKQALIGAAVWGHARNRPLQSAAFGVPLRQALKIAVATGLVIGAAAVVPGAAIAVSTALLTLPFLAIVGLRSASLPAVFRRTKPPPVALEASVPSDAELPAYTVLVALYREAAVLAQLVAALSGLDYPKAKLDIKLVLEEVDAETRRAAAKLNLPAYFEIIVVPNAAPRTKPKALNFALPFARGQYLVIFDAEDIPEPDQLRKAVAAFQRGPAELVCLQARLGIYNWRLNWLTRQFAIEYTALFDAILPTLARLGLPLPLGGTSNHFNGIA